MRLILSFDIEVWCNGWTRLDDEFPRAFERYVYGHSRTDGGALPTILEVLRRHDVRAVFFVESLFAARFGVAYLREIVDLIASAGHQIELHLHSEWADEASPRLLPHIAGKRQHLQQLAFDDQLSLLRSGLALLAEAGASGVTGFRAGSFGANADTLRAVAAAGLAVDCSVNAAAAISVPDLRGSVDLHQPSRIGDVLELPLTVFNDGFGRVRPAQIGSCSFAELRGVIEHAVEHGWPAVTLLSHNFEMLRADSARIDPIVLARFERLCAFVASRDDITTPPGNLFDGVEPPRRRLSPAHAGFASTARRYGEQLARRALSR